MLAQLSTIKKRLSIDLFDTTDDVLITNILKMVSARFAAECNRTFDYGAGLTCEFRADQLCILVSRPPIELVSQFELKTNESEGWILQSGIDYLLSPKKSFVELSFPIGSQRQLARITYTGGYVLPGGIPAGNQIPLPDDIEQACVEQVSFWYQRRAQLGLLSITSGDATVQHFKSVDLLPQVEAVLKHYERWENS